MNLLADLLSTLSERRYRKRAVEGMDATPIENIAQEIVTLSGETVGIARADVLLDRFDRSTDSEKYAFFRFLATQMNIDPVTVRSALDTYEKGPSRETYSTFAKAVEPARQELIRRLNQVPGATGTLVRMRADLLRLGRGVPEMEALDLDFRHLFASWFNRGFLVLRAVNWQSPAHILEKIIAYEAVHTIDSWDDLRRRLQPTDRRCFAFFHPAMPDEPLIFVEIALTEGIPTSIQRLLGEGQTAHPAEDADAAVFYSISNCQPGLAGISFGNSLIKQVAADLAAELPNLDTFVTLSPMPGFHKWLSKHDSSQADQSADNLSALAAYYLLHAKDKNQRPLDPVARFHLGNGAEVHAVQTEADLSEKGLSQSGGVMVNYLYKFPHVAQNQERFEQTAQVVASNDVRQHAETVILPDLQSG